MKKIGLLSWLAGATFLASCGAVEITTVPPSTPEYAPANVDYRGYAYFNVRLEGVGYEPTALVLQPGQERCTWMRKLTRRYGSVSRARKVCFFYDGAYLLVYPSRAYPYKKRYRVRVVERTYSFVYTDRGDTFTVTVRPVTRIPEMP